MAVSDHEMILIGGITKAGVISADVYLFSLGMSKRKRQREKKRKKKTKQDLLFDDSAQEMDESGYGEEI